MKTNSSIWSVIIVVFLASMMLTCKKESTISVPELTTTNFSSVTATSFICGGSITNDGGAPITSRGVCWSTNNNPSVADDKTSDGAETGVFSSSVTGLTPEKTYYFRAYATNSSGTAYGNTFVVLSLAEESLRDCLRAFPGVKGENVTTTLNGNTVTCYNINGILFFQGDIAISPEVKAASIDNKKYRWLDNKVIYTISSDFPDKNRISDSFKEFEKTNIVFKERTNESNYIEFKYIKGAGCYSYIGMIGGKQDIVIDNWGNPADIAHEIGHALGLLHEQSKSTRDQYVNIISDNIEAGQAHNFDTYPNSLNTNNFDFNSLMLYSSWAFSIQYGMKPTITKKDGSTFVPQRVHFTDTDISLINQLYPKDLSLYSGNYSGTYSYTTKVPANAEQQSYNGNASTKLSTTLTVDSKGNITEFFLGPTLISIGEDTQAASYWLPSKVSGTITIDGNISGKIEIDNTFQNHNFIAEYSGKISENTIALNIKETGPYYNHTNTVWVGLYVGDFSRNGTATLTKQ